MRIDSLDKVDKSTRRLVKTFLVDMDHIHLDSSLVQFLDYIRYNDMRQSVNTYEADIVDRFLHQWNRNQHHTTHMYLSWYLVQYHTHKIYKTKLRVHLNID